MRFPGLVLFCLALFCLTLCISRTGYAATYCVSNSTELQQALTAAAASVADDEIRIRQGTYIHTASFLYNSQNTAIISISGGYFTVDADLCGGKSGDARTTVLDGNNTRQIMLIGMPFAVEGAWGRVLVSNLTFQNGVGGEFGRGGGLNIQTNLSLFMEYWLDNLIVRNNSGFFAGGVELSVNNGLVRVVNSLFENNSAPTTAFGHLAVGIARSDAGNGSGAIIANSTFVNGTCAGSGGRGCGVGIKICSGVRADVINSLFWNNAISDANLEGCPAELGNGSVFFSHSRIPTLSGNLTPNATSPYTEIPGFVNAAGGNFRLRNDSFYINKGLGVPPHYAGNTNSYDVHGGIRTNLGVMEVGALENQTMYADGFE